MFFKSKVLKFVAAIRDAVLFVVGYREAGSKHAMASLDQHFLV